MLHDPPDTIPQEPQPEDTPESEPAFSVRAWTTMYPLPVKVIYDTGR